MRQTVQVSLESALSQRYYNRGVGGGGGVRGGGGGGGGGGRQIFNRLRIEVLGYYAETYQLKTTK